MKLPNIKGLMTVGKAAVAAHRPEILFGTSIVTTISAVVMAGVGGYKSGQQVLKAEFEGVEFEKENKTKELDVKEKIQLTWLNYLPAAGLTAGALGATTGLHIVHVKEKKALAAAALMAIEEVKEQSRDYIKDVTEAIAETTDEETKEKVLDKADEKHTSRLVDADQLYLVKDEFTGRTFYSTENKIQNSVNEVNSLLNNRDVELNSFYVWAGVPEIQDGDEFGWNNRDFITVKWEDTHLDDGRPVRAFTFQPKPKRGYEVGGSV